MTSFKFPTRNLFIFTLIIWAGLAGMSAADGKLNCDAYANAAVTQQHQNVAIGCGYSGGAWSGDFIGHRNWCLRADVVMENLTDEDRARAGALEICLAKAQACNAYTSLAISENGLNRQYQCGFTGGRWSDNGVGHRAWCMSASPEDSLNEMQIRSDTIKTCLPADEQLINIDLQNVLSKQQQTLQMISNFSKILHDTSMSVIRKIGG